MKSLPEGTFWPGNEAEKGKGKEKMTDVTAESHNSFPSMNLVFKDLAFIIVACCVAIWAHLVSVYRQERRFP